MFEAKQSLNIHCVFVETFTTQYKDSYKTTSKVSLQGISQHADK